MGEAREIGANHIAGGAGLVAEEAGFGGGRSGIGSRHDSLGCERCNTTINYYEIVLYEINILSGNRHPSRWWCRRARDGVNYEIVILPIRGSMALAFLSPLHKASRQISVYLEAETRELGVSPSEGHCLTYLRSYSPAPFGGWCKSSGSSSPPSPACSFDRLERSGLARREINPGDRRSFLVHISPEGRKLADRLTRGCSRRWRPRYASASDHETCRDSGQSWRQSSTSPPSASGSGDPEFDRKNRSAGPRGG